MRCPSEAWGPYYDSQEQPCEVCGCYPDARVDPCKCPECPECGEYGRAECYGSHMPEGDKPKSAYPRTFYRVAWDWLGGDCDELCEADTLDEANEIGADWAASAQVEGGMSPLTRSGDDGFPNWFVNRVTIPGPGADEERSEDISSTPEWYEKMTRERDAVLDALIGACTYCDDGYVLRPIAKGRPYESFEECSACLDRAMDPAAWDEACQTIEA